MLKYTGANIYIKFQRKKSLVMIVLHADICIQSSTSSFFDLFLVYFLLIDFDLYCWNLTFISLFFSRAHKF